MKPIGTLILGVTATAGTVTKCNIWFVGKITPTDAIFKDTRRTAQHNKIKGRNHYSLPRRTHLWYGCPTQVAGKPKHRKVNGGELIDLGVRELYSPD
jgi:hypothetical protein